MSVDTTGEQLSEGIVTPKILHKSFVQALYQFWRQTELHEPTNKIFERCLSELHRSLESLMKYTEQTQVEITFRGEQVYVNDNRIRPASRQFHIYRYLLFFMRKRFFGAIQFMSLPSPENLLTFLWAVSHVDKEDKNPVDTVNNQMREKGIHDFILEPLKKVHTGEDEDEQDQDLADMDLVSVLLHEKIRKFVEVCFENFEQASNFELDKIEVLVEDLIQLPEDEVLHVFRSNLMKRRERPLPFLAADACFAMVGWARALGLPNGVSQELAIATLAHPLLYQIREKTSLAPLQEDENLKMNKLFQRLKDVWPLTPLQRLCLQEFAIPYGEDGVYEWQSIKCYSHFFSRMMRIIAAYRALTSHEKSRVPLLPDEAMTRMLESKKSFDPTLLKLFVNWMGIYPVGTLISLQSGEVAQVFAVGSDPLRFQRPIVSVLKEADGTLLERPRLVDLTEMNERLGVYRWTIKKSLTLEESGIPEDNLRLTPQSLH